jgi:ankyrin repeat protein
MKRKASLIVLILLIGIPIGLMLNALHREQASRNLLQAIKNHDVSAALAALKNGADPNTSDHSMDKKHSFREETMLLLSHLIHPSVQSDPETHPTAILLLLNSPSLATHADPVLVKALLDAGADPNVSEDGRSALMMAISDVRCCRLLLNHGANMHWKDSLGRTALHLAGLLNMEKTIDCLLANGADIEAKDNDGKTPLHAACQYPYSTMPVQVLLSHHADVKARDYNNFTPLHYAARNGDSKLIDMLLAAGADVEAKSDRNWTPLHAASSYRNLNTVRALLRHHANINARDSKGRTPLESPTVEQYQDAETIQLLKQAGGKTGHELDTEKRVRHAR